MAELAPRRALVLLPVWTAVILDPHGDCSLEVVRRDGESIAVDDEWLERGEVGACFADDSRRGR